MHLQIVRDASGNVTIADLRTGKSTSVATGVSGRAAEKIVLETTELPSHSWGRLA